MGETTNSERADELARRLETLSPEQRAQLRETLRRRTSSSETIPRRHERGSAPLSFSQQRMWFLDQLEPDSPTNNGARALRLRGPLDKAALERAFTALVERHEILRTVYVVEQREPSQVALEHWSLPLSVVDLSNVPAGRREEELNRRLREESRRPFQLAADLMLRPTLFRVGEDEHVLLYVLHHIAYDASSDRVLNRELAELYGANLEQRKPQLAELPIQYADYAVWQRERLRGPLLDELTAYWRSALEDTPERLRLPTDRARAAVQLHRGRHRYVAFDGRLGEAVARLGRQNGATPYMTLLAAFDALLYGFTGQDDVVIGSPVSGRNHIELEPLIGYFSNTLVLRNRLVGNPTFMELLARVRATTTGAIAHQELPFEKLVEILRVRRDPSFNPLFQVNFRAEAHARRAPAPAGHRDGRRRSCGHRLLPFRPRARAPDRRWRARRLLRVRRGPLRRGDHRAARLRLRGAPTSDRRDPGLPAALADPALAPGRPGLAAHPQNHTPLTRKATTCRRKRQ